MAEITFYEKPGCINNTRQKEWLVAAGHQVEARSILKHPWTVEELRNFFGQKALADCFNPSAPLIKSGELDPASFSEDEALEKMIGEPILIRRPLIHFDSHYLQGFDKELIASLISLSPQEGAEELVEELENADLTVCPHMAEEASCEDSEKSKERTMSEDVRHLGEVIQIVEEMGLQVTYAFDDLVFVEHSAFLFQFVEGGGRELKLYFNTECPEPDAEQLEQRILALAVPQKLEIRRCGTFSMKQNEEDENLELQFFDM